MKFYYGIHIIRSVFRALYGVLIPDEKALVEVHGQRMYVSLCERHYVEGIFERETTEVFKRVIKKRDDSIRYRCST
jgi:hypothetical protein